MFLFNVILSQYIIYWVLDLISGIQQKNRGDGGRRSREYEELSSNIKKKNLISSLLVRLFYFLSGIRPTNGKS